MADEKPKKVLAKPEGKKKGLRMADYSVGERALEDFKKDDIVKYQSAKEKKFIDRKKAAALEQAMIEAVKAYLVNSEKRLEETTYTARNRKSLAELY